MKLEELLLKVYGLSVINKKADLSKEVLTIEQTEVPDISAYIGSNSFVITTAMYYKDDQKELSYLIEELHQKNCSALGIKLGRFIHKLDQEVIDTANELGFPLILIPMDKTLGEIYQSLLLLIWNDKNIEILEANNIKRRLFELILNGASFDRVLSNIWKDIKKSILVLDSFVKPIAKHNISKEMLDITSKYIIKNKEIINKLKQKNEVEILNYNLSIYNIKTISGMVYYVIFLSENKQEVSEYIMAEIILVIELLLNRNLYIIFKDISLKNLYFNQIVNKEINLSASSSFYLDIFNHSVLSSYNLILASFTQFLGQEFNEVRYMKKEEYYIIIYNFLKEELKMRYSNNIILFPNINKWQYILFVKGSCDKLENFIEEFSVLVKRYFKENLSFIIGEKVFSLDVLPFAYKELDEKYMFLKDKKENKQKAIIKDSSVNVFDIIKNIPINQSKFVCREILKDLAYPKDELSMELRNTLKTYLESNANILETAKKLYLHRNTIRYRIKKIENILGKSLDDSSFLFELQLVFLMCDL